MIVYAFRSSQIFSRQQSRLVLKQCAIVIIALVMALVMVSTLPDASSHHNCMRSIQQQTKPANRKKGIVKLMISSGLTV
jgi:hypothetical protein